MEIFINGQRQEVADGATVGTVIETLGTRGRRVALEVNEEIVPRSLYGERRLQPGDRVEVVYAIGGG